MRDAVPWQFPEGFVRLRRALDFWENEADWDCEGFNWIEARDHPHALRTALISGALSAFVMTEEGRLHAVPNGLWRGTYLWGEAYETYLVKVDLERGTTLGYLCLKRQDVADLWRAKGTQQKKQPEIRADTANAILDECPTIGLVVLASLDKIKHLSKGEIDAWLISKWPQSLQGAWPERDSNSSFVPSIARQINRVIRGMDSVAVTWAGSKPTDPAMTELANAMPLMAAALYVFRRARSGDFDHGPTRRVQPDRMEGELRKILTIDAESKGSSPLFRTLAQIAIPSEKVPGGGRRWTPLS